MGSLDGLYRYVRHENIARMERAGWWVVAFLGGSHGNWSVLMKAPHCMEGP